MTSIQPTSPESRDAGFRAVTGGPELASGTTLLVEAYAAIWILLFAMVALTWRRITKLETRIKELEVRPVSAARVAGSETSGGVGAR